MLASEYVMVDASKTVGVAVQRGVLILRPTYAVFVPLTAAHEPSAAASTARDARMFVEALVSEPADVFDRRVEATWRTAGWWHGSPADTEVMFREVRLLGRFALVFKQGTGTISPTFGLPSALVAQVAPLVEQWHAHG